MNDSFGFGNNDGGNNGNNGLNDFSGSQIMSQQGGGYLNNSMMSDGYAGGVDSSMTPAKNRFNNQNEPSLMPLTCKQVKNAPEPAQDDAFRIDGIEVTNATVVGRIVHINIESTHTSFTIDDGTGQMEVRFWTGSDDNNNANYSDLTQETYVRCIGKIKHYRDSRSMTGFSIRKIEDFDEITYHNLDVIHTHLINTVPDYVKNKLHNKQSSNVKTNSNNNFQSNNNNNNSNNSNSNSNNNNNNSNNNDGFQFGHRNNNNSNSNSNNNMGSNNNNNGNNNNNNSGNNGNNGNNNNGNNNNNNSGNNSGNGGNMMIDNENENVEQPALNKKILSVLQKGRMGRVQQDDSYSGCHIDQIFQQLSMDNPNDIREALDQMSTDGVIYSTVDEETFDISLQ